MMLSILIPSRCEEFLSKTVEDILEHKQGETEILVGLDGAWANPPIKDHKDVHILHYSESIGQRAITNQLCRLSKAKYIMKADAHCAFDEGFDVKMMRLMQDDYTMVPVMRNLHVFNWVCKNGHKRYQSPSGPCKECGEPTTKDIVWIPKTNPQSTAYRFDKTMHFQYWNEYGRKQKGDLTESLSIQGSCFMVTRDKYWELDLCSEEFHSWGQQGVEVACKTWLSGGRVVINRTTWYAHCFRTQGGDFGFPYPQSGKEVDKNREISRQLFQHDGWPKAKYKFQWLIDKFRPPEWEATPLPEPKKEPTKGILYYTDNAINMRLSMLCRNSMKQAGLPITSVTLKPTKFGNNIVVQGERGYKTMFKQILTGLKAMKETTVFFCEHDNIYHPDHFKFTPPRDDIWYYNGNYWFIRMSDGFAIHYDVSPLSGLVVNREIAIKHFEERLALIEKEGRAFRMYHMGFEPMTHKRVKWQNVWDFEVFMPENPNIDLCHSGNLTLKRWTTRSFIKKPTFWEESTYEKISGWPQLPVLIKDLIAKT